MQHKEVQALNQAKKARGKGVGRRKSEVPIVAKKSGNADGAKGYRKEIANEGNMCPINAGLEHGNETCTLHTMGAGSTAADIHLPHGKGV